jgi:Fic family protein
LNPALRGPAEDYCVNPGDFRAPAAGKVVQTRAGYAAFVPAPLPPALDYSRELVLRLSRADAALSHERDQLPELIQCALIHEQFEAIHPFLDGNGRVGRLLIPLFLIFRGRLSQPLLYVSAYIEAHRQEYYDRLQTVRTDGDWNGWLHFFLAAVTETAQEGVQQAGNLMVLRERFRGQLRDQPRALFLLDQLFVNPYLTVARAAHLLKVSDPTARRAVQLLEKCGMLEEIMGRGWGRLYLARPILDAIEGTVRQRPAPRAPKRDVV